MRMTTIGWHFTMPSLEVYMDSVDDTNEKKPEPKVAYIGEGVIFKGELSAPEFLLSTARSKASSAHGACVSAFQDP